MSAMWGDVPDAIMRAFRAECKECEWQGPDHYELDSEAVRLAAVDSAAHNGEVHEVAA